MEFQICTGTYRKELTHLPSVSSCHHFYFSCITKVNYHLGYMHYSPSYVSPGCALYPGACLFIWLQHSCLETVYYFLVSCVFCMCLYKVHFGVLLSFCSCSFLYPFSPQTSGVYQSLAQLVLESEGKVQEKGITCRHACQTQSL